MPFTTSPTRPEYSANTLSRSASRTFWKITCFAVCAAIRPEHVGRLRELDLLAELELGAREELLRLLEPELGLGDLDVSTTCLTAKTSICPVSSLKRLRRSSAPL
jgi:hypothetical protein